MSRPLFFQDPVQLPLDPLGGSGDPHDEERLVDPPEHRFLPFPVRKICAAAPICGSFSPGSPMAMRGPKVSKLPAIACTKRRAAFTTQMKYRST